ncbi:hypothetical protein TERTU_2879 [Teredinibacter turnerae T7901]|uniref:Uncharacterized protein n=1 Tax=Teredinibacter turnerae (strain ATCC 39867 / T7901) TaxID=377629 RepID=C5BN96_TERTT|nr:hypothetical protein TERTU_2879 [Teredinibacter turnerae T7901]
MQLGVAAKVVLDEFVYLEEGFFQVALGMLTTLFKQHIPISVG